MTTKQFPTIIYQVQFEGEVHLVATTNGFEMAANEGERVSGMPQEEIQSITVLGELDNLDAMKIEVGKP